MDTLTGLEAFLTRARVLATSAIAWLTGILAVLVVLAQQLEIVSIVGVDVPEWLPKVLASVIAVLTAVVLQVRRVTPVSDAEKGLLPPKGPAVETVPAPPAQPRDVGGAEVFILLLAALLLFLIFAAIGADWITSKYGFAFLGFGLAAWVLAVLLGGRSTPPSP